MQSYAPAFRQADVGKNPKHQMAVAAWFRMAELSAQKTPTPPYDKKKLTALLPALRRLTREKPTHVVPTLQEQLATCGVVCVLQHAFKGTGTHGATYWRRPQNQNQAVLVITPRGQWADIFWFTLFHELGHILLHTAKNKRLSKASKSALNIKKKNAKLMISPAVL